MRGFVFFLLTASLAWTTTATGAPKPAARRVLFIGNSYLYTNDLPAVVRRLAAGHGLEVEVALRAQPDYALSDHLRSPGLEELLAQPWDWIVLQQGPSSLPESRRQLVESAQRIAAKVQGQPRPRLALMSAWPSRRHAAMSPDAEASYRRAAEAIDACVLPVATAWRIGRDRPGLPDLYASDRLHPAPYGTVLAAMVVTDGLLGLNDPLTPPDPHDERGEQALLRLLHATARDALAEEPLACGKSGQRHPASMH